MTTFTLLRLPQDAPAAQGQPGLWRGTLEVDGAVLVEVTGGRDLCLEVFGLKPLSQPRGVWVDRGVPVFMFAAPGKAPSA